MYVLRCMLKGLLLDVNVENKICLELLDERPGFYMPTYGPTETKTIEVMDLYGATYCVTVHFDEEGFPCALSHESGKYRFPKRQEALADAITRTGDSSDELQEESRHQTSRLQRHLVQRRSTAQGENLLRGRALGFY